MAIANAQDYANAFIPGGGGPASDVAGGGGGLDSLLSLLGGGGGLDAILGLLGGGLGIADLLGGLFGGGRSSTGPGSATSDIASASGSSDPVLALLGMGAGALGGNTPVSSPSAGPTYGPYFDAARKYEDLLRWGPGGLSDPKAQALDATTLKNAMHELGNPGTGDATIIGLQNAFQGGSKNLTPDNIKLLINQFTPQETQIVTGGRGGSNWLDIPGGGGGRGIGPQNFPGNQGNFQLPSNNILQMMQRQQLMNLLGGVNLSGPSGFRYGWS